MSVGSCSGSVLRVQAHQLREEQVQQRPRVGQPVRRDAHVDRHAPAPQVLEPEVVGAGRRVDDRIGEDRQRRIEGRDDAATACSPSWTSSRCSASTHSSDSGLPSSCALRDQRRAGGPSAAAPCRTTGAAARRSCAAARASRAGSSPSPRNRLRAWSLKNASDDVPLPSFGKNTWPIASRSPTRCSGLGAHRASAGSSGGCAPARRTARRRRPPGRARRGSRR